jgi:hypothetical protein
MIEYDQKSVLKMIKNRLSKMAEPSCMKSYLNFKTFQILSFERLTKFLPRFYKAVELFLFFNLNNIDKFFGWIAIAKKM